MTDAAENLWRRACASDALAANAPFPTEIENRQLVLWRTADGEVAAIENRCAHIPMPLSDGVCASGKLRCRYHGLEYNRYGAVVGVYGHPLDDSRRVPAWLAVERGGSIWVWLGEPGDADEALIQTGSFSARSPSPPPQSPATQPRPNTRSPRQR